MMAFLSSRTTRASLRLMPTSAQRRAMTLMLASAVRPERTSLPMVRTAAVGFMGLTLPRFEELRQVGAPLPFLTEVIGHAGGFVGHQFREQDAAQVLVVEVEQVGIQHVGFAVVADVVQFVRQEEFRDFVAG